MPIDLAMIWLSSLTSNRLRCLAPGCTLKNTAFPAASMPIVLHINVSAGFVLGVIAPMTP